MEQTYFISVEECCRHYRIETAFIDSLEAHGLIAVRVQDMQRYIEEDHLPQLEKFINMHYEMDINIAGIEVIFRLLGQIEQLQGEMRKLHARM